LEFEGEKSLPQVAHILKLELAPPILVAKRLSLAYTVVYAKDAPGSTGIYRATKSENLHE
jgi:hypothetical protein